MKITTNSEKETFALAVEFAKKLKGGEIIGLSGDLGAGKTVFVKGIARGLGIKNHVASPTFLIMKIYNTNKKGSKIKHLCHIDAYRLNASKDLTAIGATEHFASKDTATIIEWPEKIRPLLKKTKYIKIEIGEDNKRIINY